MPYIRTVDPDSFEAVGPYVLIRVNQPKQTSAGGILIADAFVEPEHIGEIISAGPLALQAGIQIGQFCYFGRLVWDHIKPDETTDQLTYAICHANDLQFTFPAELTDAIRHQYKDDPLCT